MVNIVIPGKIPSKKNSKRIVCTGPFPKVLPSKAFQAWNEEALVLIASARNKLSAADRNHIPLKHVEQIEIGFFAHDSRRFDLTNKAESVMDLLVEAKIIDDDNIAVVPQLCLHYLGVDRQNPRAIVEIRYGSPTN